MSILVSVFKFNRFFCNDFAEAARVLRAYLSHSLDNRETAALHESFADLTAMFLALDEGGASYLVGADAFSEETNLPDEFIDQSAEGIPREHWMRHAKNALKFGDATNVKELSQVHVG